MIDIAHIGFHKTASTWLQCDVFPGCRRLHYVDDRTRVFTRALRSEGPSHAALRALFDDHPNGVLWSCEDLSGDVFDGSEGRFELAGALAEILRDGGVIAVVRSQATLLPSLYAQYVKLGGIGDFASFVRDSCPGLRLDLEHFEYDGLIDTYASRLGRERVLVLPYELLVHDDDAFLLHLSRFCGELFGSDHMARQNPSPSAFGVDALRRWNRLFRRTKFNASPLVTLPGGSRVRHLVQRRVHVGRSVQERWGPAAAEVANRFAASNRRLQPFVEYDLGGLGYPV
jgi:hypothetical protein